MRIDLVLVSHNPGAMILACLVFVSYLDNFVELNVNLRLCDCQAESIIQFMHNRALAELVVLNTYCVQVNVLRKVNYCVVPHVIKNSSPIVVQN